MNLIDKILNTVESSIRILDTAKVFASNTFDTLIQGDLSSKSTAIAFRKSFEDLGATYIKLGQLIASAPGLFPREYVEEMQLCLDQVNPLPYSVIEKVIHEEFKGKEKEIFKSIEEKPIASASIAQVHGATLINGEDVVIKVQRPNISSKLNADMNLLYLSAFLFEKLTPGGTKVGLTGIVKDFHKTIMEEIDFLKEAKNIEEFDKFLDEINEANVIVPKVYHQATTQKVLTMQRLYGVPLTDLASIKKYTKNPENTLILAMNTWFQSLMVCGFFHADVHAGNLMVLEDGRIAFIDFGIVGRMDEKIWNALLDLMDGMSEQDYNLIANALIQMNATSNEVNEEKFAKDLKNLFEELLETGNDMLQGNIDEQKMNELMIQLMEISEANGLKIPREFALLFKQMLYFDRYMRILAPELDLLKSDKIMIR